MSAEEAELSGSGSERAPDEDFAEADAEGSTELGGDEPEPTEEFDTEDEAPEEVGQAPAAPGAGLLEGRAVCQIEPGPRDVGKEAIRGDQILKLVPPLPPSPCSPACLQELESATAREMARKERERLRQQDKLRREQLERFRETANTDASKGEVRC